MSSGDLEGETTDAAVGKCSCYKCTSPEYGYDEYGRYIKNNVHGELQPCEECGRPKTEYVDLGVQGVYVCWYCEDRGVSS